MGLHNKVLSLLFEKMYGMHIGKNCVISWKAYLDKSINPQGIYIGNNTWVLARDTILSHDYCCGLKVDIYIGNNTIISV